jgi:hypothetical protein
MSRPNFDAPTIAALRERVITHNQNDGARATKLGELKAVYTQGWAKARGDRHSGALAKVDEHLGNLAKAEFDDSDHPRATDGKFTESGGGAKAATPAAAIPLPATPAEHRHLADTNAGYAALQSQVIPETRFGVAGSAARDAAALALGIGYAASLARGRSNGLAARGLRAAGGAFGRVTAGLATGIASHTAATLKGEYLRAVGRDTPVLRAMRAAKARTATRVAAEAGRVAGRKLGNAAFRAQSWVARGIADSVEDAGRTPGGAKAARHTAIALTGLVPAYAIRESVKDTPLDPQRIGAGVDSVSFRTVQKMVMSDEIGAAQALMLGVLNKGGDIGDLRKAMTPHAYSAVGKLVLSGGAALAGALSGGAIGAGVGHLSGKRGNPYHDEHGKFTSSANSHHATWGASIGAILGGAAAGLGTYAALRSHNLKILPALAAKNKAAFDARLGKINAKASAGSAKRLIGKRDAEIKKAVDAKLAAHPEVVAARQQNAQFDASAPLPYKRRVEDAVNNHIANQAAFQDAFRIKGTDGKWITIGEIKAGTRMAHLRDSTAQSSAKAFVAKATKDEFDEAIKGLTDVQQGTHQQWFNDRASHVADVDTQLLAHHTKIHAADAKVAQTVADVQKTASEALDAKAIVDRGGEPDVLEAATTAYTAATEAADKAVKAHAAAEKAAEKLRSQGPKVTLPSGLGGGVIPAISAIERQNVLTGIENRVRKSIEGSEGRAYDKKVQAEQARLKGVIAERSNRNLAAMTVLGVKTGAPGSARAAHEAALKAHGAYNTIADDLAAAEKAHASARQALGDLEAALKKVPTPQQISSAQAALLTAEHDMGKTRNVLDHAQAEVDRLASTALPKKGTPAHAQARQDRARAAGELKAATQQHRAAVRVHAGATRAIDDMTHQTGLRASEGEIRYDAMHAEAEVTNLKGDLAVARAKRASAMADFEQALTTPPPASGWKILPDGLMQDLKEDLAHAKASMSETTRAIFDHPTIEKLHAFAERQYEAGKAHAMDGVNMLFRTRQSDGSYKWSFGKVVVNAPIAAGVATSTAIGAKEFAQYAHAQVFGDEEAKKKAKRPELPFGLDWDVHPITGANYAALTVAHPKDKNERVVLYGERQDHFEDPAKQLVPGGRLSVIKGAFQNGKWANQNQGGDGQGGGSGKAHTGGLDNFTDPTQRQKVKDALDKLRASSDVNYRDIPGGRVSYVNDGVDTHGAASIVTEHMRRHFLNQGKGKTDTPTYFAGLKALFSGPAAALSPSQRYGMLTGKNTSGGGAGFNHGIFKDATNFTSDSASVARALNTEIDRAVKLNPSREDAVNLHRAVWTVQEAKGLSDEQVKPIHDTIAKTYGGTASTAQSASGSAVISTTRSTANDLPKARPASWDRDEFDTLAQAAAGQLRRAGGLTWAGSEGDIASVLKMIAVKLHHSHGLDMQEGLTAGATAIAHRIRQTSSRDVGAGIAANETGDDVVLMDELDNQAHKVKAQRVNKLDDLDELLKAFGGGPFDGAKHPRVPSGPGGGEFEAGSGGAAAAASKAARAPKRTEKSETPGTTEPHPNEDDSGLDELHPARAARDIAGLTGFNAAWDVAEHYLPSGQKAADWVSGKLRGVHPGEAALRDAAKSTAGATAFRAAGSAARSGFASAASGAAMRIAERLLPASARLAVDGVSLGARFVAGSLATMGGQAVTDLAVTGAYHAAGAKPPAGYGEEKNVSLGHTVSSLGGNLAGAAIATKATTTAGRWLGGAAGGLIGSVVGPEGTVAGEIAGQAIGGVAGKYLGGAIAGWGGGVAAGKAYDEIQDHHVVQRVERAAVQGKQRVQDWFKGMPQAHTQGAMKHFAPVST